MPTSATCLPSNKSLRAAAQGFTLLEILVVIVLAALVVGTSMVQLVKMYDSYERNAQRDGILNQLSRLGAQAVREGRPLVLEGELGPASEVLDIPPGWRVVPDQALVYNYLGICTGGVVRLRHQNREYVYELAAPLCELAPQQEAS